MHTHPRSTLRQAASLTATNPTSAYLGVNTAKRNWVGALEVTTCTDGTQHWITVAQRIVLIVVVAHEHAHIIDARHRRLVTTEDLGACVSSKDKWAIGGDFTSRRDRKHTQQNNKSRTRTHAVAEVVAMRSILRRIATRVVNLRKVRDVVCTGVRKQQHRRACVTRVHLLPWLAPPSPPTPPVTRA